MRKPWAIYAITKHGIEIGERLRAALPEADLFVPEKFAHSGSRPLPLPMGPTLSQTFTEYDCHIHIISVGAVIRMVAPLLQNKKVDPAIVCVDDAAKFAISLLSGHVGRGNAFTDRVAQILGATPVITTASDVRGTLTVDILGRDLGWTLDDPDRNVTRGCAAVVNQAPVLFVQETGEPDWWPLDQPLPPGVSYATSLENLERYEMLLIATDRELRETERAAWEKAVIYRPKSLVVGIGCDRNTPPDLVERGVRALFAKHNLSLASVKKLASIDVKKDEPALHHLQKTFGWTLRFFGADKLDTAPGIESPSEMVKKHVGSRGVAEPAALLGAGATKLVVPKQIYTEEGAGRSMTLAVARMHFPRRDHV